MVSDLFHDSSPECFSPFPRGTSSLSVIWEYLALSHSRDKFQQDFTSLAVLEGHIHRGYTLFHLPGYHRLWRFFPETSIIITLSDLERLRVLII